MSILREIVARFGVDVDASDLTRLDGTIGTVLTGVQNIANAFLGWRAVQELRQFTTEMVNTGDALAATGARLAIGTTELQELQHAATMSDVATSTLESGLESLSRRALGAVSGNRTLARTFSQLGVELRDADGNLRSSADLFTDLADGIAAVESPTERSGLAMRIFGGAGSDLVPLLARGSAGVAELRAEFHRLGGGMSEEAVEAAAAIDDEMNRLDQTIDGLRGRIALYLLPVVRSGVEWFGRWSATMLELAENSEIVQLTLAVLAGGLVGFGASLLAAYAGPLALFAAIAIAITFLILLVDDLLVMFSGGRSLIGGFIDELFGIGTTAEIVSYLTEAWQGFVLLIQDAIDGIRELLGLPALFENEAPAVSEAPTPDGLRRAAALRGEIVGGPGSTFDEALASTNRFRTEAGLAPLDSNGEPTAAVPSRTARLRARGGGSRSVDARTSLDVTVEGSADAATVDRLVGRVDEVMARRNREAAAALGGEVDDDETEGS